MSHGTRGRSDDLYQREQTFRALLEHSPDIIARFDRDHRHLYVSPSIEAVTGREASQFIGRTNREAGMPAALCEQWEEALTAAFDQGKAQVIDFPFHGPVGTRHFHCRIVPEFAQSGRIEAVLGVTRDITDHHLAEQHIRAMNETLEQRVAQRTVELQQLSRQLVLAEQSERRRLSMLLHDDLQQLLVAASMRMDILSERLRGTEHEAAVRRVMELVQQSIDSSRSLSHELSPPILYDSGLCATLPWLGRVMEERHGLRVTVDACADAEPHDEETRISLFLSARELLFNVVKHAHVEHAEMSLLRTGDYLRLTVEDEGAGFDAAQVDGMQERSFGLFSLRERIRFMGGRLNIRSQPGRGTRVEVDLPVSEPSAPTGGDADILEFGTFGAHIRREGADRPAAIRVLLADDHRILREGIAGILGENHDIVVIAEAADGREAVEMAHRHQPDIVVMDVTMPTLNGIEATRLLADQLPDVAVIGLTMHNSPDIAQAMRDAGAVEVLVKDGPSDALVRAIRATVGRNASARAE
jgi:PAS domain S-box-containing protein